jgi:hypothetical protein
MMNTNPFGTILASSKLNLPFFAGDPSLSQTNDYLKEKFSLFAPSTSWNYDRIQDEDSTSKIFVSMEIVFF